MATTTTKTTNEKEMKRLAKKYTKLQAQIKALEDEKNKLRDEMVAILEAEETTKGGIILTSSAQEKPQVAEICAVGPGGVVDGKEIKMEVKIGDKVLISKYSGTEVKLEGEKYTIVRQSDILAIVE